MLKQIDKESIHKITSGQVITTLSSALKELVENSLDAQSNSINIQFINYGIDKFEVSDNGTGISPKDFKTLAKKNCTSKLSTFDDLNKIYSYGFRGEALNSLCSLAEISIITRTEEENVGSILKFDSNGDLIENSPIACSKGTTVICQKIFSKFPVRYNELKRNLKREYSKAITTLQSLALINTQTKISIYLSTNNKFKQLVMSSGGQTLKENIIKIFGTQFAGKLYSLNFITKKEKNSQNQILEIFPFQFSGFISKMEQKYGRRTSDRQLIFVNQRPVDAPKLLQVFNEFYRKKISETSSLSRSTLYPIIIINFVLDPKQFDINVTPDKRKMFVKNERFLIEEIKLYLEKEFDTSTNTLRIHSTLDSLINIQNKISQENQSQNFKENESQNFKENQSQNFKENQSQNFKENQSQNFKESQSQHFKESQSQNFKESQSQHFKENQSQNFKENQSQHFKESQSQNFKENQSQHFKESQSQHFKENQSQNFKESQSKNFKENQSKNFKENQSQNFKESQSQNFKESQSKNFKENQSKNFKENQSQHFKENELQNFKENQSQHFKESQLQNFKESQSQHFKESQSKNSQENQSQNFKENQSQNFKESQSKNFKENQSQHFKENELQNFKENQSQNFKESQSQNFKENQSQNFKESQSQNFKENQSKNFKESQSKNSQESQSKNFKESQSKNSQENPFAHFFSQKNSQQNSQKEKIKKIKKRKKNDNIQEKQEELKQPKLSVIIQPKKKEIKSFMKKYKNKKNSQSLKNQNDNSQSLENQNDNSQSLKNQNDNSQSLENQNDNSQSLEIQNDNSQSLKNQNDNSQSLENQNDNSQSLKNQNDNSQSLENQIQVIDSNFIQNIQQSFIERKNENETISVSIGIQNIQNMFENYSNFLHNLQQKSQKPQLEISDQMEPSKSNSECEAQLQLVLQKEDFLKMEIIGQFNKGFIITKLGNDLFLVDQHAADEKFNYENLLKNSPISTQQLFQPLSLELTTQEELIIEENLDIFHANGFRFSIDKEGKSTQRIKVTSFPISKGKMFTQDDLYEIISHLSQSPGIMYRPNKVSAIFASKACRSSVMIGQSLDFYQMRKIVDHLSSLDHPWKCPHGRPSIRHLCSLSKNN